MNIRHPYRPANPTTLALAVSAVLLLLGSTPTAADEPIRFNRDIRPILTDNCLLCHGPDQQRRKADLRLDERDDAVTRRAIVPGQPDQSELVRRIFHSDPDELMPPPDSHKKLTGQQRELLKRWIAEGAEYEGHWAYLPPQRPEVPAGVHPIDYLVAQQLEKRGLEPAPEADRRTLARRLAFDLLGLPATPEEVDAFTSDRAPDAWDKLVRRWIDHPAYGERMAISWLDVVRFADTIGYHSDNPRNVWPYRDYVIRAFSENKPFDRFTIEQLAGDLMPQSTQQQKVASAFNRLLLTTEEGGAQAKDYEARMLGDRVRAVGTVWLGQTLGCCQCHDHKFDPSTARDFYAMGAFFADLQEPIIGAREPGMLLPNDEEARHLAGLVAAVADRTKEFDASPPALLAAQEAWEKAVLAERAAADRWTVLKPASAVSEQTAQVAIEADGTVAVRSNPKSGIDTYRVTVRTKLAGITGLRLDVSTHNSLPDQGPGRAAGGGFVLTEFSVTDGAEQPVELAHASASFERSGFPASAAIDGKLEASNGWSAPGTVCGPSAIVFELTKPVGDGSEVTLVLTLRQLGGENQVLGRFRCSATVSAGPVRAPAAVLPTDDITAIIAADKRDEAQKSKLTGYYKGIAASLFELRTGLAAAKRAQADFEATLPRCLVSSSMPTPRTVRILPRGNWLDDGGEVVRPAVLHYLPQPEPVDRPLTRLDLAQWLVTRDNPLTARVFVNRLWRQFFGTGLSRTLDDFGAQGEWPSHPELLDWLACEFMDSGWDVKHLVRTIVTSRTYRQSSTASRELLARDPENRELARQGRFRLDAELVRDNALAVSGLLVAKIGGPSVKVYQPEGYWENLNFPVRQYVSDRGDNQYRRGLYTWWQRSFLHPSLLAFDAPTREECAADRPRSNIPQQALVLLNDPTYVEAARALAARIVREGSSDPEARITWAWRQVLARPPRDEERTLVRSLVDKHLTEYADDTAAADALTQVGFAPSPDGVARAELAAWTSVARVLLNLHETITRP